MGNDLAKYINLALAEKVPCSVELGAAWDNEARDAIKIQTRTTFELNAQKLPFEIGYVILEDGMSGEGAEWAQRNDYSGIEDIYDKRLEELTKLPVLIYGQKYDHVPVAAWGAYKGVDGSLPSSVSAGVPIEGSFVADIGSNKLIQNKENLSVVTKPVEEARPFKNNQGYSHFAVSKKSGKIINAAKCKVGDTLSPSSITSTSAENSLFDVYDMLGRKVRHTATSLNGLSRGIYIINGRKVVK